jgi:hypothetical protein
MHCLVLPMEALVNRLAADFYVESLPGQPSDSYVKMHAGYDFTLDFN